MNFSKKMKKVVSIFEILFCYPPTHNLKDKLIVFAPIKIEIITNSLLQPIWNSFYDRLILCLRVNSANYFTRLLSKLPKLATFKPP